MIELYYKNRLHDICWYIYENNKCFYINTQYDKHFEETFITKKSLDEIKILEYT